MRNLKGQFIKISSGFKGKHHTKEANEKNRLAHLGKYDGSNNHFWKGGSANWWKKQVLRKDNYTCKICGMQDYQEGFLEADHIKQKALYQEIKWDINNGQTLCPNCHKRKTLKELKKHE